MLIRPRILLLLLGTFMIAPQGESACLKVYLEYFGNTYQTGQSAYDNIHCCDREYWPTRAQLPRHCNHIWDAATGFTRQCDHSFMVQFRDAINNTVIYNSGWSGVANPNRNSNTFQRGGMVGQKRNGFQVCDAYTRRDENGQTVAAVRQVLLEVHVHDVDTPPLNPNDNVCWLKATLDPKKFGRGITMLTLLSGWVVNADKAPMTLRRAPYIMRIEVEHILTRAEKESGLWTTTYPPTPNPVAGGSQYWCSDVTTRYKCLFTSFQASTTNTPRRAVSGAAGGAGAAWRAWRAGLVATLAVALALV